ncbi:MAG: hypothetical protein KUG77_15990 [Nannocystaceae bacterium]|nr:hypothetical protein [Nannocystaceae bacterium]
MNGAQSSIALPAPAGRDITDTQWDEFDKLVRQKAAKVIEGATSGAVHRFQAAIRLISLSDPKAKLGKRQQCLREHDNDAYEVLEPRKALVDARRAELFQTDEVQKVFSNAKRDAAAVTLGSLRGRAQSYRNYLMSPAFAARLETEADSKRSALLTSCLVRLHTLEPSYGEIVAEHWTARQLCRSPIAMLQDLPQQQVERALVDVLEVLAKLSHEEEVARGVVPAQLRGAPPGGPVLSLHKCLAQEPMRTSIARALTRGMKTPYLRDQLDRVGTDRALRALADYDSHTARFVETLRRTDSTRRMFSTLLGAWALAATCTSPDGAAGDQAYRHRQAASSLQAAVAFVGSTDETLCAAGDAFNWVRTKITGKSYRYVATGAVAPNRLHLIAKHGLVDKTCKGLGPLGEALSLYVSALQVGVEMKNHDTAGTVAAIGGCLSAVMGFCYTLTVIGGAAFPPFLIVSAVIGVGAFLLNEFCGTSGLTGKITDDLTALGVFGSEAKALSTYKRSIRENNAGGSLNRETAKAYRGAPALSLNKRLEVINGCIKGKTKATQETIVWTMFRDSRSVPANFVYLIEATDPARIADELEDDNEARDVMLWALDAYQALGRPPGRGFNEQLVEHCSQHRSYMIVRFFRELDRPQRAKAYDRVPGSVLREAAGKLCKGHTNGQDECTLSTLLAHATLAQLDAVFANDYKFARRVKGELTAKQWKALYRRMVGTGATSGLRAAAKHANG